MRYGDLVEYDLRESHGGNVEQSYVIGEMTYSDDRSHVLLACPKYPHGMPIHSGHCNILSSGHEAICAPLRAAYLKDWPNALKAVDCGMNANQPIIPDQK